MVNDTNLDTDSRIILIRKIYGILLFDCIAICSFGALFESLKVNPKTSVGMSKFISGLLLAVFSGFLVLFILAIVTFEKHKTKYLNWFLRIMFTLSLCYIFGGYVNDQLQFKLSVEMMIMYAIMTVTILEYSFYVKKDF